MSLPPFAPFPQSTRSAKRCAECKACAYCGQDILGRPHDHDHAPIPWRHGGRHVVAACAACHGLRDYKSLERWPGIARQSAADGLQAGTAPWVMALLTGVCHPDSDMEVGEGVAEIVTAAINDCTTAEARVALAFATGFALDCERRRSKTVRKGHRPVLRCVEPDRRAV